jgi:hypothetical protein
MVSEPLAKEQRIMQREARMMISKRIRYVGGALFAAVLLAAVLAALGGSQAAAATPAAVTIQEFTVFGAIHEPPVGTFIASGLSGCTTGGFVDNVVSFSPSGARLILDRTYSCDAGGTITARVALHLAPIDADGHQASNGTWRIVSADGVAQAGLQGSGTDTGVSSGCTPAGSVFGACTTATGTVTAAIH